MVGTLFWLPAYRPEVLSPSSSLAFVFLISFGLPNGLKKKKKTHLVAQLVKNPPAVQENLVQFPGGEGPLEKS